MNEDPRQRVWLVALALAVALGLSLVLLTAGVLYDAIASKGPGLSDNATQVLVAGFGGIIGVLGSYVGYRAGAANGQHAPVEPEPPPEPEPEQLDEG